MTRCIAAPLRLATTAAAIERDGGFDVFGTGFRANACRSGADRFDGDAAALKHRDQAQTIGPVDDDFEPCMPGADAAREMCNRTNVRCAPWYFAPVVARAPLVSQYGPEIDRGRRQKAAPL
jgi:hypothetical protein